MNTLIVTRYLEAVPKDGSISTTGHVLKIQTQVPCLRQNLHSSDPQAVHMHIKVRETLAPKTQLGLNFNELKGK